MDELKLKKIPNSNYLVIINDSYKLNQDHFVKGQCVKQINNGFIVSNSTTQQEVDEMLSNEKITRIVLDRSIMCKSNVKLKRSKNGEIRNTHVIILPDKDDDETFHVFGLQCFFIKVCDVLWYKITSQSVLDELVERNINEDSLNFDFFDADKLDYIKDAIDNKKESKVKAVSVYSI